MSDTSRPLPLLKKGDTIGVMAPSSHIERIDIEKSKAFMESRGYKVFIHPQTFERNGQMAGNVLQKTLAFQGLWQRDDIDAIWAAGGGNRAMQLLQSINFEKLKDKPKALIGYSDVTNLLNAVYVHTGIPTYHGPVFRNAHRYGEMDHLLKLLETGHAQYPIDDVDILREGEADGIMIGGNLSVFQCLPHVLPGKFWRNSILFLEDCGDEISRFDRMFLHLRQMGVLSEISGLMIGRFKDIQDNTRPFGFTLREIVLEHMDGYDTPIIQNFAFGHGKTNYTIPVGCPGRLFAKNNKIEFVIK